MTPEEVCTILEPLYTQLIGSIATGNIDQVLPFFDENAVVIDNGELFHKHIAIRGSLEKMWEAVGPQEYKMSPKKFDGCSTLLSAEFEFEMTSPKVGTMKGRCMHIWRKNGDKYLIVREDFQIGH